MRFLIVFPDRNETQAGEQMQGVRSRLEKIQNIEQRNVPPGFNFGLISYTAATLIDAADKQMYLNNVDRKSRASVQPMDCGCTWKRSATVRLFSGFFHQQMQFGQAAKHHQPHPQHKQSTGFCPAQSVERTGDTCHTRQRTQQDADQGRTVTTPEYQLIHAHLH